MRHTQSSDNLRPAESSTCKTQERQCGRPDVLRHAQRVVVGLTLVTSFSDLLDSSESDRKMVAVVPAARRYGQTRARAINKNKIETHLTGRLRFFSKSNVVSKASSCAQQHALKRERAFGLQITTG